MFQELFGLLYTRLQPSGSVPGKRFRFKGQLFSLDGSLIDLSMKVFPWADIAPKKAAFKLHLRLDHDGLIPAFAEVSGGLESEMDVADFLDHSMNAVASQIFVALCVYLLVGFQKFVSRSAMGIQAVLRLVQLSLFQRKPLADLLRGRKQDPSDPQMPLRLRAA